MEIKKFVKIYDEILPEKVHLNLVRYAKTLNFEEAKIIGDNASQIVNFNIRSTYTYPLNNNLNTNSFSSIHWFCLLTNFFSGYLKKYPTDLGLTDCAWKQIIDVSILKYENTGFYTWHVDHYADVPRTMSCILLLNNDYEGGNLCFRNPDGSEEWEVEVKPNRMIIWPSNFLYPHTVKPVTKGTRYSVVAWAL
jgi:hypothetical protein